MLTQLDCAKNSIQIMRFELCYLGSRVELHSFSSLRGMLVGGGGADVWLGTFGVYQ